MTESPIYFRGKDAGDIGGLRGKEIASQGRAANLTLPPLRGTPSPLTSYVNRFYLSPAEFALCQEVYENNQTLLSETKDLELLQGLENWFLMVIEPPPPKPVFKGKRKLPKAISEAWCQEVREWQQRENDKREGYTAYCDPELAKLLKPDPRVMARVRYNCQQLEKVD